MVAKFVGNIRRDDFRLRTKYPYLKTRIFYTGGYNYLIFVENLDEFPFLEFDKLKHEFEYSIKMLGNPSFLINEVPKNYIEEYEPIQDDKISENFEGAFFTDSMLINFLKAKYNSYKIVDVKTDFENQNFVVGLDYIDEQEKHKLQLELDKLGLPFTFVIEQKEYKDIQPQKDIDFGNPILNAVVKQDNIMQIPAYSMQPIKLDFIKRDESLWFDNIDKVYSGEFTKENLSFFNPNDTSCLIDYTAACNIDIRNVLLMYDTIYLMLPLKERCNTLFSSSFSKENLFSLIETNRVKFVNVQPEERLDFDILKEAYSINPNSVINRRALSLLSVIDTYDMCKNFIMNDNEIQKVIYDIVKTLSKELNINVLDAMEFVSWPKQALRESFERFNTNGIWAYGQLGVNTILQKHISKINSKDLSLEFMVTSQNIHLANALNATLFPSFTYDKDGQIQSFELNYANIMGKCLNFYKYASKDKIKSFKTLECLKLENVPLISPIDIFDIDAYIPFEEFTQYCSSSAIRSKLNLLFNKLASLSLEERRNEIIKYNEQILKFQEKQKLKLMLSDGISDILGILIPMALTGSMLPLLLYTIFNTNTLKNFITKSNTYKYIEHAVNDLNNYIDLQEGKLSDIDVLSQISRVAKLKNL